jgi:hypothetical protein
VRTPELRRLAILAVLAIAGCGAPADGPPASPRIDCLGVPAAKCDEAIASVARSLPNTSPVAIEVSCVMGACTTESGAMDTVVTLADGSQLRATTNWGAWAGGGVPGGKLIPPPVEPPADPEPAPTAPAAVVPVEPQCQGVPLSMCRTLAETAFGEVSDEGVIEILVRCIEAPCTEAQGAGDTQVNYEDGTTRTSSWAYAGD